MKQMIKFRWVPALILFFLAACSGTAGSPTASSPLATQTEAEQVFPAVTAAVSPTVIADARSSSTPATTATQPAGAYTVHLTPNDFVDVVDNPYFPLPPGARWEYEIREANGSRQKDTIEVMQEKRLVNGIQATVVRDTVSIGNQPVEDTYDWFAQDKDGNVWYVGEAVDNYLGGVLVSHSGSWEWGVDGALPGIIMWADPSAHVGEQYRQEYYTGRAEDLGQVLGVNESLTVPFGSFEGVVRTLDTSAIETRAREHKFYAPGIGLLKELDLNTGEEMVLTNATLSGK